MIDYDKVIPEKIRGIQPSGIRKFFDIAQQVEGVISLSVGEPDFKTPWAARKAAIGVLEKGRTAYTANAGLIQLREEISKYLLNFIHTEYDPNGEIIVTVGGSEALDLAMRALIQPGDEVLVPEPSFVCYSPIITVCGGTPVPIVMTEEDKFKLRADALKAKITPRTKALILPFPNNPTGSIMRRGELEAVAEVLRGTDIMIISDEIYSEMTYGGEKHVSIAEIDGMRERTIVVNGFSKTYAMTGWRIGYAAARADVIKGIMAVQSQTTSATSAISQKAAVEALRGPQHDLEVMVEEFRRRKDYVVDRLNRIPGITCPDVKGAFYVYPDVQLYLGKSFGGRKIETAVELCQYLLDEALISTVPGEAYNVPGKIRISYSNSMENLEKALDRMEQALAALH